MKVRREQKEETEEKEAAPPHSSDGESLRKTGPATKRAAEDNRTGAEIMAKRLTTTAKVGKLISLAPCPVYSNTEDHGNWYAVDMDFVAIDERASFRAPMTFRKIAHELVHSTGAESRLNRKMSAEFADAEYSLEECVAEVGAMILMNRFGVDAPSVIKESERYLAGWMAHAAKINNMKDEDVVRFAMDKAKEAVEYLFDNVKGE